MNAPFRASRITHGRRRMSNPGPARTCRASGNFLPSIFDLRQILGAIWPLKTVANYAATVGIPERTARYHLSNTFRISGPELATLLRSEHGLHILEEIMGDAQPRWWRGFRRQKSISVLRAQQASNEKLLRALEEQAAD